MESKIVLSVITSVASITPTAASLSVETVARPPNFTCVLFRSARPPLRMTMPPQAEPTDGSLSPLKIAPSARSWPSTKSDGDVVDVPTPLTTTPASTVSVAPAVMVTSLSNR